MSGIAPSGLDTPTAADSPVETQVAGRRFSFNVRESGFAWQLGAGLNYEVQDGVHLGLGYRYFRGPNVRNDIFLGKHDLPVNFDQDNHTVQVELTIHTN